MTRPPAVIGVVLAGGRSRRMGQDKGALEVAGKAQVRRAYDLLASTCGHAVVSARAEQATLAAYARLPLVTDDGSLAGPAAGLMAAWARFPGEALLVLAVDLPLVDAATIGQLLAGRDPARMATAFGHPDGTIEPLCTVWEPRAAAVIAAGAGARTGGGAASVGGPAAAPSPSPSPSLRRILEAGDVALLEPAEPARLASANTPAALAALNPP